jgi:hypothetical protein
VLHLTVDESAWSGRKRSRHRYLRPACGHRHGFYEGRNPHQLAGREFEEQEVEHDRVELGCRIARSGVAVSEDETRNEQRSLR